MSVVMSVSMVDGESMVVGMVVTVSVGMVVAVSVVVSMRMVRICELMAVYGSISMFVHERIMGIMVVCVLWV